ncbi:hypothetical protein PR202_gb14271 [Eleusine coracana subsp. coracana]|uniref:NAD-dependent epimerase/dehydratase domain-containing protein n=1 Tax=Eleusine coracana subsp. coracana TaxID=191504 RepID=A0AAV5EUS5_ELECO|nr:hypothetical protein PR202_gb14271 [Eleusine coracana subsp. coracana]
MAAAGDRKKTACVTGGNGYIASLLIKMLLEKGYVVKTTKELIEPAVQGTLNVLRSCVKAGTVKRVVLTSSTAAVSSRPLEGDGNVLDEESWSDVEYLSAKRTGLWAYPVSKVLLEKAASEFAEEHGISLVTLCPSVTVGEAPDRKVYTTVPAILSLLSGDEAELRVLKGIEKASGSVPLVHVQDVCLAQLFVVEKEGVPDGRYICNGLDTTIAETAKFLADKYPEYNVNTDLFGEGLEKPIAPLPSTKLINQGFQFNYNTLAEIYDDMVGYGKTLGILPN